MRKQILTVIISHYHFIILGFLQLIIYYQKFEEVVEVLETKPIELIEMK